MVAAAAVMSGSLFLIVIDSMPAVSFASCQQRPSMSFGLANFHSRHLPRVSACTDARAFACAAWPPLQGWALEGFPKLGVVFWGLYWGSRYFGKLPLLNTASVQKFLGIQSV